MIRDLHYSSSLNRLYAATDDAVVVWNTTDHTRVPDEDIPVVGVTGIWSDDTTIWCTRNSSTTVAAFTLATKAVDASKNFSVDGIIEKPGGMDVAGGSLWISNINHPPKLNVVVAFDPTTKAVKTDPDTGNNLTLVLNSPTTSVYGFDDSTNNLHYIYPIFGDVVRSEKFLLAWKAGVRGSDIYWQPAQNLYFRHANGTEITEDFHIRGLAGNINGTVYGSIWEEPNRVVIFSTSIDPNGRGRYLDRTHYLSVDHDSSEPIYEIPLDPTIPVGGGGLLDDRSYVDITEGLYIAQQFSPTPPVEATFQNYLLMAMPYVEQYRDKYVGLKTRSNQRLQWPRKGSANSATITIRSGEELSAGVVPYTIKQAQVFTAVRLARGENPFRSTSLTSDTTAGSTTTVPTGSLIERKVGSITLKYSAGGTTTTSRVTDLTRSEEVANPRQHELSLHDLLRPFLRYGRLGGVGRG